MVELIIVNCPFVNEYTFSFFVSLLDKYYTLTGGI